ncbi:MAG: hypothetical protein WKF41_09390 [Gaiellaceae bacterium]
MKRLSLGVAIALLANLLLIGGVPILLEALFGDSYFALVVLFVLVLTFVVAGMWSVRDAPRRSRSWWDYL